LARDLGVDQSTISGWQTGRQTPTTKHIPKVIEFLGYSPFDINNASSLAERIVMLRKTRGLTGKALAKALNVNDETLSRWERGEVIPSPKSQALLESFFASTGAVPGCAAGLAINPAC
jgi:transcriptional regulator with XRE-family HTH domain